MTDQEKLQKMAERMKKETDEWAKRIQQKYYNRRFKIYKEIFPHLSDEEIHQMMRK